MRLHRQSSFLAFFFSSFFASNTQVPEMQTKHHPTTIQNAINYTKTNVNRVKKYCILHFINREMKIMVVRVMKKKRVGKTKKILF